jgi:ABC-type antimicrobial peptide transport system permease subunit
MVRARSPGHVPEIEDAIRRMGYDTRALATRLASIRQFFVFLEVLLASVGTVALLVAGLGILNTLLMSVLERYSEIGLYKAIGASSGDIRTLFLTEAAVLGFVGGLGGLLLAKGATALLQLAINAYAERQNVAGLEGVFLFPLWLLLGTIGFSIAISIVSGLYPAHRAASVDPIQALRRE